MGNTQETIFKIIEKHFKVPLFKITPESQFIADFGADSLDVVEFVLELEDAFDINITDNQAQKITTVKDAIDHIELIISAKK
jgi:acyl carrier protein